jgi:hypothetical protein
MQVSWLDAVSSTDSNGRQLHQKAQLQDGSIAAAGQAVQFSGRQLAAAAAATGGLPQGLLRMLQERVLTGLLQCMWETEAGEMMAQASVATTYKLAIPAHLAQTAVLHTASHQSHNPWLLLFHSDCQHYKNIGHCQANDRCIGQPPPVRHCC